jgi:uncharacterized circularly permuted ATP-grasp superfamily protein/uncharacterized alpha-E superfamily protein
MKALTLTSTSQPGAKPGSPQAFREAVGFAGLPRAHWRSLWQEMEALGPQERLRRFETAGRIIHEQGVTYNVYGDAQGMERPWELDPLPMLVSAPEWKQIERGLIQRATLINTLLADCYGGQRFIRSGDLPPALLFAQSDFLRAAHGIKPGGGVFLNFYAADIARAPDGQWWVLSDRTQIPTGAGYSLANRLVTARVLPEAFRENQVHRLAGFFRTLQSCLSASAPQPVGEPRVVVLTPGPYNETYFEQAYLARYLGYSLVEGQDLTVQNRRVYLKTLSGLEQVDVIVRRVDDAFCDPLELRNDSILGVPGLTDAIRAGHVTVSNALGSGILQSSAFRPFLPGLCRAILGEPLLMPSVATWWCGQQAARDAVLSNLENLDVRPAFGGNSSLPKTFDDLRRAIQFAPHKWSAQERMQFSLAPCWERDVIVERPVELRVFLLGTPDGYIVMPGGLARTGAGGAGFGFSMQNGGASKDTWVLSEQPVEEVTLLAAADTPVEIRRVGNNLPSRLADNFFWMGRYTERLDASARALRAALLRFSPETGGSELDLLQPLLRILAVQEQLPAESLREDRSVEALEGDFLDAIYNETRAGSLRNIASRVCRLAMLVRDRTSNDLWRALSQLEDSVANEMSSWSAGEAIGLLNRVLMLSSSFKGIVRENMTRAQGWRFLDMGQRIERSLSLCNLLQESLSASHPRSQGLLESILEIADSTITYRSRYNLVPNLMAVYDLVLLDDTNPRSMLFQLLQLEKHLDRLPRKGAQGPASPEKRLLLRMLNALRLLDPSELGVPGAVLERSETAGVLSLVYDSMPRLSELLAVTYFEHSHISRTSA